MAIRTDDEKNYVSSGVSHTGGDGNFKVFINSVPKEKKETAVQAPAEEKVSFTDKAETAIAELRNQYSQQLREQYDYSANKLREERDAALRENWILQQRAEAALPEQLAEKGINGGATETTLADLKARYQGERNDIREGYIDEIGELMQEHGGNEAKANREYSEKWLEYLLSLAEMEEDYKHREEFAKAGY